MKLLSRLRSLWSSARAGSDFDAETEEEFRLHTELRARDLERQGYAPAEAILRARQEFGNPARMKEEVRASRGLRRLDAIRFSWLDFKLGFRMLTRYPGLTIVGTLAISVGIAVGTLYFEALNKWQNPQVPFAEGDRVVSIRLWDRAKISTEGRALFDFGIWRDEVRTIENLGAAIPFERTLSANDEREEPVRGADISASAFRLARVTPVLGRTLMDRDELPSEPPVVVISYALWENRFASDPQIVGRSVTLGTTSATIVGVMPEGFGFPVNQRIWAPLRANAATVAPRSGPNVQLFGRLARGAALEEAEADLATISRRIAADNQETHKDLVPRVTSYAKPLVGGGEALIITRVLYVVNGIFVALLVIICANVATLVFARTATRGWEITMRHALGASRGRIMTQLFVEALVLTGLATLGGLLLARLALGYGMSLIAGGDALPFWIDADLSLNTVVYAGILTFVGAAIVGLLPAVRVTRGSLHGAMRAESAGRSGLRFGGFWTGVIVFQVALTVAFLPLAAGGAFTSNRFANRAEGIGAEQYLIAGFALDQQDYGLDSASVATRMRSIYEELEQRIRAEPGVLSVTFADRLPVEDQFKYSIEVDTLAGAPTEGLRSSTAVNVGAAFFETFGTSVVAGRDFVPGDYDRGRVLIVNESFASLVFGGRNPIGQRVRILDGHGKELPSEDWYEIVGMVKNFGWTLDAPQEKAAMYYPRLATGVTPVNMAIRARDPEALAPRLRVIAAETSPLVMLYDVQPLASAGGSEARLNWAMTSVAWLVGFIVLLLSATGIHAMMAFTVARRTREIGIRVALGAGSRRLVSGIFSRAFMQIGLGVLAGAALAALWGIGSTQQVMVLLAAVGVMLTVGLLACAVPLRRALRIEPTEALRAEV